MFVLCVSGPFSGAAQDVKCSAVRTSSLQEHPRTTCIVYVVTVCLQMLLNLGQVAFTAFFMQGHT